MPYQGNIPQATDQLSQSQGDLLNNFQAIQTAFEQNHGAFNGANQGYHEFLQFPDRTGNTPAFGGLSGMWSENGTFTGVPEIWVHTKAGGGFNQYPMTSSVMTLTPLVGNNTNGWSYFPSGIVMKWGVITVNGATAVNLNAIGPVYGATFIAQATCQTATVQIATIVSLVPATLTLTANNFPVYWFVIGRE